MSFVDKIKRDIVFVDRLMRILRRIHDVDPASPDLVCAISKPQRTSTQPRSPLRLRAGPSPISNWTRSPTATPTGAGRVA